MATTVEAAGIKLGVINERGELYIKAEVHPRTHITSLVLQIQCEPPSVISNCNTKAQVRRSEPLERLTKPVLERVTELM